MKKVFLSLAVVAMFSFAACNGNSEATDTTAPEETTIEETAEPIENEATEAVEGLAEEVAEETEAIVAE